MQRFIAVLMVSLGTFAVFVVGMHLRPEVVHAEESFEVSGWIPYWKSSEGTRDARKHLDVLTEVNPFAYTVTSTGKLKDLAGLKKGSWKKFIKDARKEDVLVIPSVMWSAPEAMHAILSNPTSRTKHIKEIVKMLKNGDYDGVDIDYEGKWLSTKDPFSSFIAELDTALGDDFLLSCTIESRTPPDSLYRIIPDVVPYATNLDVIQKHCDSVKVMTYDQRRADIKENDASKGAPYVPVADVAWVRKVMTLMSKTISKDKMLLGVATYGHEYEVVVEPEWYRSYNRLWALNPKYALDLAKKQGIKPSRNKAGEMSFSYPSIWDFSESLPIPNTTRKGDVTAARALAFANATGKTVTFNYVTWSDADAIKEKVDLAKELGLAGVAIFKIDGGEDPDLWDIFEE